MEKLTDDQAREYAELVKKRGLNLDKFNELLTWKVDPMEFYETLLGYYFSLSDLFAYGQEIEDKVGVLMPDGGLLCDLREIMEAVKYVREFPKH